MSEKMRYVEIIKNIIDWDYGKEIIFYDNGRWYSRKDCDYISLDELEDWVYDVASKHREE